MASLALALLVVTVVGFTVPSTRWLAVLSLALLIVLHPWLFLLLLCITGGICLFVHLFFKPRSQKP